MRPFINYLPCTALALISFQSAADLSATVTAASDYLFNGVSQTDEKPAIQGSIDWVNQQGWYLGSWGSSVDFGDDTDAEVDYYAGFSQNLNQDFFYDAGLLMLAVVTAATLTTPKCILL